MDTLKELYIEPTSRCNLQCAMCSRGGWRNEAAGDMSRGVFDRAMDSLPESVERIFFGGVGEPLCHPDILYMLRRARESGRAVEMITNGTLLDREMSKGIIGAGLGTLWVSLDSVEEKSYEAIRSGAKFNSVMENIRVFNEERMPMSGFYRLDTAKVRLGVAFVLMKDNLAQYRQLLKKAYFLGISEVKATHLIPYGKSQAGQTCYDRFLGLGLFNGPGMGKVSVDMPLMDTEHIEENDILPLMSNPVLAFSFMGAPIKKRGDYCRFVREGVAFVRWDGEVCPCMALLHENSIYQQNTERRIRPCSYGNVNAQGLSEIWESESYAAFRRRVTNFEFSPCTQCGACNLLETNEEDCFQNPFPVCGACLWAQGLYQCP